MSASLSRLQSSGLSGSHDLRSLTIGCLAGCRRTRLVLLFEVGAEPPHDGIRGGVELSFGRPRCRLTAETAAVADSPIHRPRGGHRSARAELANSEAQLAPVRRPWRRRGFCCSSGSRSGRPTYDAGSQPGGAPPPRPPCACRAAAPPEGPTPSARTTLRRCASAATEPPRRASSGA